MLSSGTRLGAFEILSLVGSGGMGEVYRARDTRLGREVAIKILSGQHAPSSERLARFQQEAEVLASLNHPHIGNIYGVEEADAVRALVLEFVDGDTLAERIAAGHVSRAEAITIAEQIAGALAAAHSQGIIHRDLKPANIKITPDHVVKVLDFGLAKSGAPTGRLFRTSESGTGRVATHGPSVDDFTQTGAPISELAPAIERTIFTTVAGTITGTAAYMSPEQARGESASAASDMYSFGLVLQEVLTGRPPYDLSSGYEALIAKVQVGDTIPVTGIDADLAALIRRLKSLAPAARPTAVEAAQRLEWVREKPRRRLVRLVVAAAITIFALGATKYTIDLARERDRANQEAQVSQQVTDFMTGLFRVADPSESRGKTVTALELLNSGARQIEGSLADQPEVQARLMETIGQTFDGLGLYAEAQTQLERVVETRRRVLGDEHPETLRAMTTLAGVYVRRQLYQPGEKLFKDAIAFQARVLGAEHPDYLAAQQDLGWLLGRRGEYDEGEKLVRSALDAERRLLGNEHPNTLRGINRLANVMAWRGRPADQERLLVEERDIRRRVQGSDHPATLQATRMLAGAVASQGRLSEAEQLNREVLESTVRVLGSDHRGTAIAMNDLAHVLLRENKLAEAERLLLATITVDQRTLGAESDDTLLAMNNLGTVYILNKQYREAGALFGPLLETSRRIRGPEHPRTLAIMNNLALVYANQRRHEEALRLLHEAIATARRTLGEQHPLVAACMFSLAEVTAQQGSHTEALKFLRDAIDHGYRDAKQLADDEYFVSLRNDPRFIALLKELQPH